MVTKSTWQWHKTEHKEYGFDNCYYCKQANGMPTPSYNWIKKFEAGYLNRQAKWRLAKLSHKYKVNLS